MADHKRKRVSEAAARRIGAREASVNAVAGRVRGLWLGFLTLGTYLAIATGSVTHRQLFLVDPIRLPILNDDTDGHIAEGIVRRVLGDDEEIYAMRAARVLVNKDRCPAAKHLSEETLAKLEKLAENPLGDQPSPP